MTEGQNQGYIEATISWSHFAAGVEPVGGCGQLGPNCSRPSLRDLQAGRLRHAEVEKAML